MELTYLELCIITSLLRKEIKNKGFDYVESLDEIEDAWQDDGLHIIPVLQSAEYKMSQIWETSKKLEIN